MPDALLTLLKWCLLALVYLFFFRVVQATWMSAIGPKKVKARPIAGSKKSVTSVPLIGTTLVVVEPPGMAGRSYQIGPELTIGRSAGSTVTLDDTYISQLHARVTTGEGGVVLEDLGSTNGTYLNRQRVVSPVMMAVGDRLQLGSTVMELQS